MPWSSNGGGWQGGGQGPWGGRPGGNGSGGGGGSQQPPDLEELLRRSQEKVKQIFPGGGRGGGGNNKIVLGIGGLALLLIWAFSCFYRVLPDERGVELMFGRHWETTQPGLQWHWVPFQSVIKPKVERVNRVEIGFRSAGQSGARSALAQEVSSESLMLTGDENIVDINFVVLWKISVPEDFLFNIRNAPATIKAGAESVMREIIGKTDIAEATTEGRRVIADQAMIQLQELMEEYGAGVLITAVELQKADPPAEVIESFRDVQRAQADRERARNEAEAFANDIIPRARGEAEQLVQNAEAYREEVVARAEGEAQRFASVLGAFEKSREVTARRIYLETMEEVLRDMNKIVIDGSGTGGVVPYLPLNELNRPFQGQSGQSQQQQSQQGGQ